VAGRLSLNPKSTEIDSSSSSDDQYDYPKMGTMHLMVSSQSKEGPVDSGMLQEDSTIEIYQPLTPVGT
jgi:hypothetical protein